MTWKCRYCHRDFHEGDTRCAVGNGPRRAFPVCDSCWERETAAKERRDRIGNRIGWATLALVAAMALRHSPITICRRPRDLHIRDVADIAHRLGYRVEIKAEEKEV